jgi:hypothetical protein
MAKAARTFCDRCESRIVVGEPFCGACGHPTSWATLDERAAWEVAQYREKSVTAPIRAPADDAPRLRAAARDDLANQGRPARDKKAFGLFSRRRQPAPALVLPDAKRVEPAATVEESPAPAAILTMVRPDATPEPAPAPVAAKPQPRVAKPAPRTRLPKVEREADAKPNPEPLAAKVERAMDENERVADMPATVLAMRMLNQRVRELDEKIQKLERELTARSHTAPVAETAKPRKRFW